MQSVTSAEYLRMMFSFFATCTVNMHLNSLKKKKIWERYVSKGEKSYVMVKKCTFFRI